MIKRIVAISDIHGCYEELQELYNALSDLDLDEIWHLGDLCDRGPDSHKVIEFCRLNNIKGVLGNHDESIINHWKRYIKDGFLPNNPEKQRTLKQLTQEDIDYLLSLPYIHIIDHMNLILVHAGVYPKIPLYAQPSTICRLQLVHPDKVGATRWWGPDAASWNNKEKSEEDWIKEGWDRWYKVYDHEQDVIFGHSTWNQPLIYKHENAGTCIGIDTGSGFGGMLTACVYSGKDNYFFISVKNKKEYVKSTSRIFLEG